MYIYKYKYIHICIYVYIYIYAKQIQVVKFQKRGIKMLVFLVLHRDPHCQKQMPFNVKKKIEFQYVALELQKVF